ncbi:aldehyde oxidoreductase molybdenum-binding subunit PaoC [Sphingomonas sp. ASY06-1R]|uniref:aldehyde oxidoreductase molybdenum-binding subunit PaoC n=1 Tax=Sphingomonas sp. ASY06-1R TaxID=3445771 RepID=UPI003FA30A1E
MRFDTPAGPNPIDQQKVIGQPITRIDGPLKVRGMAPYAYERHDVVPNQAYGYILGAAIAKGKVERMDISQARAAPGVITVVTTLDMPPLQQSEHNIANLFGGSEIVHYHQAVAIVVAETFEQARAAAHLIVVDYARSPGEFDLERASASAKITPDRINHGPDAPPVIKAGDFATAFRDAPVKLDRTYTTPAHGHSPMEPHASIAAWDGDNLTIWTSAQMIGWWHPDVARALSLKPEQLRIDSPFIGGGFGSKLYMRCDSVLAALAAKAAKRPVKVAQARTFMFNNSTHRAGTIQHIQLGAERDGRLVAISHTSTSGNLPKATPEPAAAQTALLYAAANREVTLRLAMLDLSEAADMRAPGETPGLMAFEMAMDELAEELEIDPVELRIRNDTQVDPTDPSRPFSQRHLIECLRTGADRFGWSRRNPKPGQVRDGIWLVGMGVATGFRNNLIQPSAARITLEPSGAITVETSMTDIGTGTYTIIAQTAAEMLGVNVQDVTVKLGDSRFPKSAGSGGQWGANSSTAGVYAAAVALRKSIAEKLQIDPDQAQFSDGNVTDGTHTMPLRTAAKNGQIVSEDGMEYGDLSKKFQQSTFAAHFCEVAVNAYTGEMRIRRMLAVCDAGRILNKKTAHSQVIGGMTMGVGAALMEELAVEKRFGLFINHDLAGYEVPVHADIPELDVIFLDYPDDKSSPMKAKGVGELGLCGVGAAVANAVYNATGVRIRDYPITLDKHLAHLPAVA